ncbi:hypothetical protein [Mycolicibacterium palauense]|uniref:hypothetical protein n=1 Tax=Mycolicibacterium palauense TaxID=2034511 RepID=UPI000BFEBF93|nr:hypothetical protein [Mycolicibacterium palauense]
MASERSSRSLHRLSTPRAAGLAGVLFALLFGTALVLIRTALPDDVKPGSEWVDGSLTHLKVASVLMPFAGICFLWFIGVVRDGFGRYEDRFFASVFLGSGLLFLAMMFVSMAVGGAIVATRALDPDPEAHTALANFAQFLLITLSKTYSVRMGAVFMISLATIWLKTRLMPRWLTVLTYVSAIGLLIGSDLTMWLTLAFPTWVFIVSLLALTRAGVIDLHFGEESPNTHDTA